MPESQRAVFKVFIRGAIEAVWREITKSDEPQGCFFGNWMETNGMRPGGKLRMRTANKKHTGVVGDILEFDPPRRFAHTFKFTNYEDAPCKVIYDLREVEGGVEFTLTVDEMPAGTKTAKQMSQGGTLIVNALKSIVETGRPTFMMRMIIFMSKLMGPFTPKRCRSENWP